VNVSRLGRATRALEKERSVRDSRSARAATTRAALAFAARSREPNTSVAVASYRHHSRRYPPDQDLLILHASTSRLARKSEATPFVTVRTDRTERYDERYVRVSRTRYSLRSSMTLSEDRACRLSSYLGIHYRHR